MGTGPRLPRHCPLGTPAAQGALDAEQRSELGHHAIKTPDTRYITKQAHTDSMPRIVTPCHPPPSLQ